MSDQAARERAITNHNTTFLVEAGAGTGKTTLLIDRICSLIESGVRVEKIAAVTFTVKAAGQLKSRLRKRLREIQKSEAAEQALRDLDRMFVNTIHGLASEILRTLPVEAALPPEFTLLDELQEKAHRSEHLHDWLLRALNEDVPSALELAQELGFSFEGEGNKNIEALFDTLLSTAGELDKLNTRRARPEEIEEVAASIPRSIAEAASQLSACTDSEDTLAIKIRSEMKWCEGMPEQVLSLEGVRWLKGRQSKGRNGNKKNWSDSAALDAAREVVQAATQSGDQVKQMISTLLCSELVRWITPAVHEYHRQTTQRGAIGFDALLTTCRHALKTSQTARRYLKERFSHIHVDEFQDTDPVQVDILMFLAEQQNNFAAETHEIELSPGKLFMVGDPKQAIYSFRGADVRIYNRIADEIERTGEKLLITRNFRSRSQIIDEVNSIFPELMAGAAEDDAQYVPLDAAREENVSAPAVELLLPHESYNRMDHNADSAAETEARAIAAHLTRLMEQGDLKSYSDAAILMRSGTKLNELQEALSAAKIPFISFMNAAFAERIESECLITLCASLLDPHHTVATIGTLRSPLFAVSDDELLAHKLSGRTFVYIDPQPETTRTGAALKQLAKWHARSTTRRPSELLEEILADYPVEIHFGLKPEGLQRVQNVATFISMIRALEAGGVTHLRGIVERMSEMKKLVQSSELEALDETRKAVQLLTLHKAKGLEFPVVYLYRVNDSSQGKGEWLLRKSLGKDPHELAFAFDNDQGWKTENYVEVHERTKQADAREEIRLQYVGLTRARDRLVLPTGFLYKKGKADSQTPVSLYTRYFDKKLELFTAKGTLALETRDRAEDFADHHPFRPLISPPADTALQSGEADAWRSWNAARNTRLEKLVPPPEPTEEAPSQVDWKRLRAQRIGSATHTGLEKLARGAKVDLALKQARAEHRLSEDEVEETEGLLRRAAASKLFTEVLPRARRVFTELPVTEQVGTQINSRIIDLLFEEDDGSWTVLDFKTDDVPVSGIESLINSHYGPQVQGYARLIGKLTGTPVRKKLLYFIRPDQLVEL
ncbi:MAG: UvrD-helicase domain-containing protein [Calditrichaeota bacterium]|nr:UvrD-helicase domain-containing protein [Calditrichota bacterium]